MDKLTIAILLIVIVEIACGLACARLFKLRRSKWLNGFLLGIIANLWGVLIASIMYRVEKSTADQVAAMGLQQLNPMKAAINPMQTGILQNQCSLCHVNLDFKRKTTDMGAFLDLESLTSRAPYKCRACNTIVCYECASTGHSGCPICGGKVFDLDSSKMRNS